MALASASRRLPSVFQTAPHFRLGCSCRRRGRHRRRGGLGGCDCSRCMRRGRKEKTGPFPARLGGGCECRRPLPLLRPSLLRHQLWLPTQMRHGARRRCARWRSPLPRPRETRAWGRPPQGPTNGIPDQRLAAPRRDCTPAPTTTHGPHAPPGASRSLHDSLASSSQARGHLSPTTASQTGPAPCPHGVMLRARPGSRSRGPFMRYPLRSGVSVLSGGAVTRLSSSADFPDIGGTASGCRF